MYVYGHCFEGKRASIMYSCTFATYERNLRRKGRLVQKHGMVKARSVEVLGHFET